MNKHLLKDLFSDREFNRRLWKLALPMALQRLLLASVAAADALMLGSLDQNSMSAVSLATQLQFIQNLLLGGMTVGISVLGAQYWGKGNKSAVDSVFWLGLRFAGVISVLFGLGCIFFPVPLMTLYTNEQVLIDIGSGYLKIAGISYILTGFSQCYLTMMKVSGHATQTAVISGSAVGINIVLNAVLIFGLFGAPAMGVRGAALATLISRVAELVWSVALSFRAGYTRPSLKGAFRFSRLLTGDYLKVSLPVLGACVLWGVGFTSYSAFMGHLGTDAVAANSVAAVVRDLVCCACDGAATGGSIMLGHELGAGRLEEGRVCGEKLMVLSYIIGFASTLVMLALTPLLIHLVRLTGTARELLIGMMMIMAFYMIGRSVNTVIINGLFDSGGDTVFDFYSLAVVMWGIAVPLAALGTFVFHWHPLLVYACTCLDEVGKIPWVMVRFKKYKWVKDLTRDELD